MKVRIILEAKKDFGCTLKGNRMIIINDIFCPNTGIAFFPIDYKQWEVISHNQFTGIKAVDKKEIFNGDYIESEPHPFDGKSRFFGNVVFDEGCFCLEIIKMEGDYIYDEGNKIPLYNFNKIKIISI